MLGIGLGMVFRGRASTGGSDIIGLIVSRTPACRSAIGIMLIDFFIISASGLAFRNLEAPLYGYIVLFLSTKVIDMILEGWNYSKLVIITSTGPRRSQDFILQHPRPQRHGAAVALPLPQPRRRDHPDRHPPQAAGRPAGSSSSRSTPRRSSSSMTPTPCWARASSRT